MPGRKVKCPKCGKILMTPEGLDGRAVRCGLCRTPFRIPPPKHVPEDTIAGWLGDDPDQDDLAAKTAAPIGMEPEGVSKDPPTPKTPAKKSSGRKLRIVSLERNGALFEFAASMLRQDAFRCAIPRRCAHCLAKGHLSAHVLIYTSELRDSITLEAEHKAGHLTIPQDAIGRLHGPALLAELPEVPGVPEPGNLPMPYWVCDLCSGARSIYGQLTVDRDSGRGRARLFIRNLYLAQEFFANAGGQSTRDYAKLSEFVEHMEEDRWDALPSVVRHRLEQWFRPNKEERFLAYVPDRAFMRTEDGMNGLVISDKKLVFHHPPLHQESLRDNKLTIALRTERGDEVASIEAGNFKRRTIVLDRQGMMLFRRALSKGRFKAEWK